MSGTHVRVLVTTNECLYPQLMRRETKFATTDGDCRRPKIVCDLRCCGCVNPWQRRTARIKNVQVSNRRRQTEAIHPCKPTPTTTCAYTLANTHTLMCLLYFHKSALSSWQCTKCEMVNGGCAVRMRAEECNCEGPFTLVLIFVYECLCACCACVNLASGVDGVQWVDE